MCVCVHSYSFLVHLNGSHTQAHIQSSDEKAPFSLDVSPGIQVTQSPCPTPGISAGGWYLTFLLLPQPSCPPLTPTLMTPSTPWGEWFHSPYTQRMPKSQMLEETQIRRQREGGNVEGGGWGVSFWGLREALPAQGRLSFPMETPTEGWMLQSQDPLPWMA